MNRTLAGLTVIFAPFFGALAWLAYILVQMGIPMDMSGSMNILAAAYIYGLIFTVILGLPVGFAAAAFLRRFCMETRANYLAAGLFMGLMTLALSQALMTVASGEELYWSLLNIREFAPSALAIGATLGLGYWQFVRGPLREPATKEAPKIV